MDERRVAVVGGGLAGLAAAHALARGGISVALFEAAGRVGGRAVTDELDGVRIDPGAQLFGSMFERFLRLVRDVGLGDALVRVPGRDALWRNGRAHEVVYGSVSSMASSGGLPFRTKVRMATSYVPFLLRHASAFDVRSPERLVDAGMDVESIASWGERELDAAFVDALVYPQLGAYYGSLPEETSAGFYHSLAYDGMDVSLYAVEGGVGRVAEALAERVRREGGAVRLNSEVERVLVGESYVELSGSFGAERFDAVVAGTPAPVLVDLLRGAPEPLEDWLGSVRYRPTLSLALLLDQPLTRRHFGLSFPRGETRWIAAIAIQESKGVPFQPPDRGALVVFPTPEMAQSLIGGESREILDRMLPEILRALPEVEGRITRARVHRWPVGSPIIYPGYLERLASFNREMPEGDCRIAVAGDYLLGPTVEGAVASGLDAAGRIATRIGQPLPA
jgi:protoporphyrinogen/coproporphyrinogen III oxidase